MVALHQGYWLYSEYQTGAAFVGIPADGLRQLQPGWNLVSPVSDCILTVQADMTPCAWRRDASGAYRRVGAAELLKAGECYWLFVSGQQPVSIDLGGNNAGR
ncbi:MAG: hypothetical protein PHT80_07430 [Lentisphaeria bacterium]|nr:hypothetical protein [Lentisphaeria bacterium]